MHYGGIAIVKFDSHNEVVTQSIHIDDSLRFEGIAISISCQYLSSV